MRVLITGGDGFIGWPTAMRLSRQHDVYIVDNCMRRRLGKSLTPIVPMPDRCIRWQELTGLHIEWEQCNITERLFFDILKEFEPDAIIHLAVQPSAPYSMRSDQTKVETIGNNVLATSAVLVGATMLSPTPHVIHIGTMGVYGYGLFPGEVIPEGYIDIEMGGVRQSVLHPTSPGSIYHCTKVMDQTLFAFFARNDSLRITELHQGIVWGTQTPETREDDILMNRFDYDGDFGTVLNRFMMQAAIGHPLTVHGTGEQTRAFININDTVKCLELALDSPPAHGDRVRIMNQMTEVHRIIDLANMVANITGGEVSYVDNPRKEAEANDLAVSNQQLRELGLRPTLLQDELMQETHDIAQRFMHLADRKQILATSRWERAA